ncbi:MAG TPA: cyclic nucleotide-binding protein [Rhodospirillaceae bacterium]|nr:cyclic nucleotide-binding protein [Rhodospirillaceae bacterium]|tara:strand:+ start:280 stop:657 length:378 start_codon:yes stop_codon:yes gene_type:complete
MSERFDFTKMFRGDEEVRALKAGDVLFREGDPGDLMYVVKSGDMEIMVRNHVLEQAGPGCIVGELALVDNSPRSATVTAVTDCEVIPIDRRGFTFMIQNTPFFALHVMGVLADRLRGMNVRPLAD